MLMFRRLSYLATSAERLFGACLLVLASDNVLTIYEASLIYEKMFVVWVCLDFLGLGGFTRGPSWVRCSRKKVNT